MKASGFPLGLYNFLQSLALHLKFIRNLYLSKVLPMDLLENEALLQTHLSTATTVCEWWKTFAYMCMLHRLINCFSLVHLSYMNWISQVSARGPRKVKQKGILSSITWYKIYITHVNYLNHFKMYYCGHWLDSHCSAIITTVHLQSFFIFQLKLCVH